MTVKHWEGIKVLETTDTIPLTSFPGCAVDFNAIFQDEQAGPAH
jgi:hypothetical protein